MCCGDEWEGHSCVLPVSCWCHANPRYMYGRPGRYDHTLRYTVAGPTGSEFQSHVGMLTVVCPQREDLGGYALIPWCGTRMRNHPR